MKKDIKLAKNAGFCYGVKRAVETTIKLKEDNPEKKVCVLGELIHNSNVISDLKSLGIETIDSLDKCNCDFCVIRSHGASPEIFEQAKSFGFKIIDLTCPDVKKVQEKAIELVKEGRLVLILGKAEHPEVVAIKAHANLYSDEEIFVVSDLKMVQKISEKIKQAKKVGVVVQTTQQIDLLKDVTDFLLPNIKDLKIFNTICKSTSKRQTEASKMAKESDLMVVVGSKKSANTSHLAKILENITSTIHIENQKELEKYKDLIKKSHKIGITAGASTPDYVISEVIEKLKSY